MTSREYEKPANEDTGGPVYGSVENPKFGA
jgi:hypothetical protein